MTTSISEVARKMRTWFGKVASEAAFSLHFKLAPVPASRPKVSRWGVYYGKKYAEWRKNAAAMMQEVDGSAADGPLIVFIENILEKPRTSTRAYPVGDVDNFAKGPMDIITKAEKFWKDDDQVVGLAVFKRFAEPGEEAGTKVKVFSL